MKHIKTLNTRNLTFFRGEIEFKRERGRKRDSSV